MPAIFEIGNVSTLVHADTKTLASLRGALSFRARVGRAGSVILSKLATASGRSREKLLDLEEELYGWK